MLNVRFLKCCPIFFWITATRFERFHGVCDCIPVPRAPVANMCFKVYGYISMAQALTFVADFKLGHYMKIRPRAMFTAQMVGTRNSCSSDCIPVHSVVADGSHSQPL